MGDEFTLPELLKRTFKIFQAGKGLAIILVRMVHTAGSSSHCSCIISSTVISNELDVNLYPES